jgi:hypothetical protein
MSDYKISPLQEFSCENVNIAFLGLEGYDAVKYKQVSAQEKLMDGTSIIKSTLLRIKSLFKGDKMSAEIFKTGGDITRLNGYKELEASVSYLQILYTNSTQARPSEVLDLVTVMEYLIEQRSSFMKGFKEDKDLVVTYYTSLVLAVLHTTEACIMSCVDVIKTPQNTVRVVMVDNLARDTVVKNVSNLARSIRSGRSNEFLKSANKIEGEVELTHEGFGVLAVVALFAVFLWSIRDIVYFYYATRNSISNYMANYAKFLELHANSQNADKTSSVKQLELAKWFRKQSDSFKVDVEATDKRVTKEIKNDTNQDIKEIQASSALIM